MGGADPTIQGVGAEKPCRPAESAGWQDLQVCWSVRGGRLDRPWAALPPTATAARSARIGLTIALAPWCSLGCGRSLIATDRLPQNLRRQTDVALGLLRYRLVDLRRLNRHPLDMLRLIAVIGLLFIVGAIVVLTLVVLAIPTLATIALVAAVALAAMALPTIALALIALALVILEFTVPLVTAIGLIVRTALTVVIIVTLLIILVRVLILARILALLLKARIQNAIVVVGMLKIVLSGDAVSHLTGIARHGQELFHQLLGVAARPHPATAVIVGIPAATAPAAAGWTWFAAHAAALTVLHVVEIIHR